ncbi:hypothetical protein [Parvicella tangerina]|uniref:Lipoprotein n=1 Tax=Parvicella tangerina TaxID=2829795 RepID=A0A916NJN2_9FLAO|nr:hypothetical protein [Parvicella tangerina]CAG5087161.1 hypothetical protein CRYO30217_03403 [Parvicella tangerina]
MKTFYYSILAVGILFTACAKEEASEIKEEITISKEVKAEVVNGETTVTITTTENGETTTEILTGSEAEAYMSEEHIPDGEHSTDAKVIVKKMDHDVNIDLDIDEILNDPELKDLDEATRAKIKTALEGAMEDMEFDIDVEYTDAESDESIVKTKVMVIDEDE